MTAQSDNMNTKFLFKNVKKLPSDALFAIKARLAVDTRSAKVDLGIGAYRDNNGKPWILPSVKRAEEIIKADPEYNHEYLNISGLEVLRKNAARIIFGDSFDLANRVVNIQSLSGTGALHVGAKLMQVLNLNERDIYFSDPTWGNHYQIFQKSGFSNTKTYPYWDAASKKLNLTGFLNTIKSAVTGSIFVLHPCAHNPTGLDPTQEQWKVILEAIKEKQHLVLFDSAYQGFATGSLSKDAYSIRLAITDILKDVPVLVCQSFAKNVGMYGERVGCFHVVLPETGYNAEDKDAIQSQLNAITRSELSTPPAYGAKIVATILSSDELYKAWSDDMITMSSRIYEMRHKLVAKLVELKTPGTWDHITTQVGMFSYTGLTEEQVARMEKEHAVYLASSGRASIAGLNDGNVEHVAYAIDEVVRHLGKDGSLYSAL
ncbi:PLP-dependent transferase [Hanseniaspora valbyensis NRRL Y-1626]|uniref:Aspartate aminotransferase n=1 Tax=Hanseniaspora valbyensis NRRL Y-1626 TaxID=766949 RepID=A0A1B7TJ16_9ASCO|nr:PLP-dependent transferase [Hanseniaspora valbyensis NRRL Y-1626]